jgi:hypothetical protein
MRGSGPAKINAALLRKANCSHRCADRVRADFGRAAHVPGGGKYLMEGLVVRADQRFGQPGPGLSHREFHQAQDWRFCKNHGVQACGNVNRISQGVAVLRRMCVPPQFRRRRSPCSDSQAMLGCKSSVWATAASGATERPARLHVDNRATPGAQPPSRARSGCRAFDRWPCEDANRLVDGGRQPPPQDRIDARCTQTYAVGVNGR